MANDVGLIELWDGKRYDAKQLEETYPAVVWHARLHAILDEEIDLAKFESKQHRKPVSVRAACLAFCLLNLGVVILSAVAGIETSVIVAVASGVAVGLRRGATCTSTASDGEFSNQVTFPKTNDL